MEIDYHMKQRFVHLRVRTEYSLLNSLISIKEITKQAKEHKFVAVGMMDDFMLSGAIAFSTSLAYAKVKPLLGLNICVLEDGGPSCERCSTLGFLAMNEVGYRNIIQMLKRSEFKYQKTSQGNHYIRLKDVCELSEGVICLSGGYNGIIAGYALKDQHDVASQCCNILLGAFKDRFYIELTRNGRQDEKRLEDFMLSLAYQQNIPVVATNDVHFVNPNQYPAYDALTCIRDGSFINDKERVRLNKEYYLKTEDEMIDLFSDIPEAIDNTLKIAKRCSFMLKPHAPMLPSFCENKEEENELFRKTAQEGLNFRLKDNNIIDPITIHKYQERLDFEIEVIIGMGFTGYFLIVCDFVNWAKDNDIPVGAGRGSGAGSVIAWSMKITNVDPVEYGLIFERFLNPERVSMPDFDVDFCQSRREEVIEYVRQKYGQDRVVSIITFGKLQARAALKDAGRVLQIPYGKVDEICKLIPFNPIDPVTLSQAIELDDRLKQEALKDDDIKELIEIALEIEGTNRHTSTHAAGIVIGKFPIEQMVPVHKDPHSAMAIEGFNMKDAEKVGLVKFDFLGLKTLTVISDTIKLVKKHQGLLIDIDKIDLHDKETLLLLKSSRTKGIFQLEATVPREALQKIDVEGIRDLSAITSLNRPGPMENIPYYIKRKNGQEEISYPHESAKELLQETYGIIIYQEQVMKMAQIIANYSLGGADILRRAMGKKNKEEMEQQKQIFLDGATKNHISEQKASEIFALIEKFAGYGFNKSHAVAYSTISYQTAYLKAHFPVEFLTALLNLDLAHTEKIVELINEAKSMKIGVVMPDVNLSNGNFSITKDGQIVYGLGALKNVGLDSMSKIVSEREVGGKFKDVFNLLERCSASINRKSLESFIKSGALDSLYPDRFSLLESLDVLLEYVSDFKKGASGGLQDSLFGAEDIFSAKKPVIKPSDKVHSPSLLIQFEFEAFGFYPKDDPVKEYEKYFLRYGIVNMSSVQSYDGKDSTHALSAGVITKIAQRFSKKGRFAFLSIADSTGMAEFACFNDKLITEKRELFAEGQVVLVLVGMKIDEQTGLRLILSDIFPVSVLKDAVQMGEVYDRVEEKKSYEGKRKFTKQITGDGYVDNLKNAGPQNVSLTTSAILTTNDVGSSQGGSVITKNSFESFDKKYIVLKIVGLNLLNKLKEELGSLHEEHGNLVVIDDGVRKRSTNITASSKAIYDFAKKYSVFAS